MLSPVCNRFDQHGGHDHVLFVFIQSQTTVQQSEGGNRFSYRISRDQFLTLIPIRHLSVCCLSACFPRLMIRPGRKPRHRISDKRNNQDGILTAKCLMPSMQAEPLCLPTLYRGKWRMAREISGKATLPKMKSEIPLLKDQVEFRFAQSRFTLSYE